MSKEATVELRAVPKSRKCRAVVVGADLYKCLVAYPPACQHAEKLCQSFFCKHPQRRLFSVPAPPVESPPS